MKTLISVFAACLLVSCLLVLGLTAYAEIPAGVVDEEGEMLEEEAPSPPEPFLCPVSKMSDNGKCMNCHQMILENGKPKFGLKEIALEDAYGEKPFNFHIIYSDGELAGSYLVSDIRPSILAQVKRYILEHPEIKKLIMEVHSPGGSVMDAWRMVGILDELRAAGIKIETRCYGMAASAGGLLLIAGDIGSRFVGPHSHVMIHKVMTFSMFSVADPDSSEDKTDMLKHFQKNINEFFAERTNISVEELNSNTFHRMWWLTGREAVELGVADRLIGE